MSKPAEGARPLVLQALRIENLAIVDRLELCFASGLNVLTGETGAGKSILVGALSLILGGRAQTDLIRDGASEAAVEALLDLASVPEARKRFEDRGIAVPDGELVIRRVVAGNGRSRVTINGQMATVGMLAELTRGLIDISGQHEHVSLLDPDGHLERVDAFGGHGDLVASVAEAHGEVLALRSALDAIELDEAEKARREDFLRFQLDEIAEVDPRPGEIEILEVERRRLKNVTQLVEGARRAEAVLYSDDGAVVEALGRIQHELESLSRLDDRLVELSGSARSSLAELEDLARRLARYTQGIEADPGRLEEVDERLEVLRHLSRKHGGTVEAVLAAQKKMAEELDTLINDEARRADLSSALEAADAELSERAEALSRARTKAARALERAVQDELRSLSMGGTRVQIDLLPLDRIGARGAERAEILIAPNPGEPPRALHKTASGGELSRLLLAMKQVLARSDAVGAYVFDEVDSGIGGAVAEVVGRKLAFVARARQVVSITHLPQVAAFSEAHFRVHKTEENGRTVTRVERLDEARGVEELARMLGGVEVTDKSRQLAREMRARARSREGGEAEVAVARAGSRTQRSRAR